MNVAGKSGVVGATFNQFKGRSTAPATKNSKRGSNYEKKLRVLTARTS